MDKTMAYIYLLLFLAAVLYVYFKHLKAGNPRPQSRNTAVRNAGNIFWLMAAAGLVIRIVLAVTTKGHNIDMNCFSAWSASAASDLPNIYQNVGFIDYPPTYIYVLALLGKLAALLQAGSTPWLQALILKLPSILADLVTAWLIYKLSKNRLPANIGLLAAGAYLFNPAVLLNASVWGQVDSFLALMVVSCLLLLQKDKIALSSVLFAAAVLMKPQGLFFLPILLFDLIRRRKPVNFLVSFVSGLTTSVLLILPFSAGQKPWWIVELFQKASEGYKYASVNAFNLFALVGGNWKTDDQPFLILNYQTWGYIFAVLVLFLAGFLFLRAKDHTTLTYVAAIVMNTGIFLLFSRIHERYMFPVIALSLLAFVFSADRRWVLFFGASTLSVFVNVLEVYIRSLVENYWVPAADPVLIATAILNIGLFVWLVKLSLDISGGKLVLLQAAAYVRSQHRKNRPHGGRR